MSLTDAKVRAAKPKDKPYKLSDGGGMFLAVQPSGAKYFRFKYRFAGKEKLLALGVYPDTGLADARERLAAARKLLAAGKDPAEEKKEDKRLQAIQHANSFESVAREWVENQTARWTPRYKDHVVRRLEVDVFPKLGGRPIAFISPPELLGVIKVIEKRKATELAHRMLQICGQIFMYGIATARAERNPANDLRGALKPHVAHHFAFLKEQDLPEFLGKLAAYQGNRQYQLAVWLLLLTFVRTSELRGARWDEIDLDKAEWRIPSSRMKMRRDHIVPLSKEAVTVLKELKLLTGTWQYVFPNPYRPIQCMSENGILSVLARLGYKGKATGHGFRHTASTILNEHGFPSDHIELQLAHVDQNRVRGTYNHALYLQERRKMLQWWAGHLKALANQKSASKAKASQ